MNIHDRSGRLSFVLDAMTSHITFVNARYGFSTTSYFVGHSYLQELKRNIRVMTKVVKKYVTRSSLDAKYH